MRRDLGVGDEVGFLKDILLGLDAMCFKYNKLFLISVQQQSFIKDVGSWENYVGTWDL